MLTEETIRSERDRCKEKNNDVSGKEKVKGGDWSEARKLSSVLVSTQHANLWAELSLPRYTSSVIFLGYIYNIKK